MNETINRDQRYLMRLHLARVNMTALELAGLMGLHANTVGNWARGYNRPLPKHVIKLASYLGLDDAQVGELLCADLRGAA